MAETLLDHLGSARGPLLGATHVGTSGEPGEGPYVTIWLLIESKLIAEASYETPGCPSSVKAASTTVRLVRGREIKDARKLDEKDLLLVMGGLPEGRGHFATMCIGALARALEGAAG